MASAELIKRIESATTDLEMVKSSRNYVSAKSNPRFESEFQVAKSLADNRMEEARPYLRLIEDVFLDPIAKFLEAIPKAIDSPSAGQTTLDSLVQAKNNFLREMPLVMCGVVQASGILNANSVNISQEFDEGLGRIDKRIAEAKEVIEKTAQEVLESAYQTANKISVKAAQDQFSEAAKGLKWKSHIWMAATIVIFIALLSFLWWQMRYPPTLIKQIVEALSSSPDAKRSGSALSQVPLPLLIAASAYFTSIRLALIGVLGVALAFSLRMFRAYLHMVEHNLHKLRVTNSIEAFVASFRTSDQKELVLGKLVESVTQFGDSGLLSTESDSHSMPSVIFDSITKNVGKSG